MNLYELSVAFTKLSVDILKVKSRTAILELIRIAGGRYVAADVKTFTPYERRRHRETLAELERLGLVELSDSAPGITTTLPHKLVNLPTNAPWTEMSLAEMKTYIALFLAARHGRNPWFTFTGTHAELAKIARVKRQTVGAALTGLVEMDLISVKVVRDGKRWAEGTQVQLKDPESGALLNDLAWGWINGFRRLPTTYKYKLALRGVDPRIDELTGFVNGLMIRCPFCHHKQTKKFSDKRTLRISFDESEDKWFCSRCRKHGDSTKLCAARRFHIFRDVVPNPSRVEQMAKDQPATNVDLLRWVEEGNCDVNQ